MGATEATGKVLTASISVSAAATDETIIAAVSNKRIRVLSALIQTADEDGASVTFGDSTGDLSGEFIVVEQVLLEIPYSPVGWFATGVGEALLITTDAQLQGTIVYQVIA